MSLQSSHSSVLEMYMKKYRNIKIYMNQSGKIEKIEKEEHGFWKTIATQKKTFETLPVDKFI